MAAPKPVILCILDGWGIGPRRDANAPLLAHTPNFDRLMATCPHARLTTHGPTVGLPEGQMGNSEVGHMTIGAGRVVLMDLGRVNAAIADGSFAKAPPLTGFAETVARAGGLAHLIGVASDGGVHGHIDHVLAAARALTGMGVAVAVHALTDGRDVAPDSALADIPRLDRELPQGAFVATVSGRYYAMDRDRRWDRVERAWSAIARGVADHAAPTPEAAVRAAHARGETDEFVAPTVIGDYGGFRPGDGLFCLNFRADRVRQILRAFLAPGFSEFDRRGAPRPDPALGMAPYADDLDEVMATVFPRQRVRDTLGAWVAAHGLRQFRLAETEKYPHVTFFLDGGREETEPGEDRFMAPSPHVATYDLQPEMSAPQVADRLVAAIGQGYDLIVVNFANPDMVGHTGVLAAAIRACEAVDAGLGRALDALAAAGGAMIVTADHGNCETMVDPDTGGPHTAHTTNPVPVILVGGPPGARLRDGTLQDLAPTLLDLMGIDRPAAMTGHSLIERGAAATGTQK
jgi:2,3-bisphosphoglycerate-independent phosphoglycerate mutase